MMYVLCESARVFMTVTYSMGSGRLEGSRDTFPSRRVEQYMAGSQARPTRTLADREETTRTAEPRRPRQLSARADTSEWQLPTRSHNRSRSTSPTRKSGRSGYEDSNDFARPRDSQRSRSKSKSTP